MVDSSIDAEKEGNQKECTKKGGADVDAEKRRKAREKKFRQRQRRKEEAAQLVSSVNTEEGNSMSHRNLQYMALKIVRHFVNVTKDLSNEDKQKVWDVVKGNRSLGMSQTDKEMQVNTEIVSNLKDSMQLVKRSCSNDKLAAKRATLSMSIGQIQHGKKRCYAKDLGIHPRNVSIARKHRISVGQGKCKWALEGRKKRKDRLSEEVIDCVVSYWTNQTRVSPNAKDVRSGRGKHPKHPTHYLDQSQTEFFLGFKAEFPHVEIKQRSFEKLKPYFVVKLKDFNTCCCMHHERMTMLREGINKMRNSSLVHPPDCSCECNICNHQPGQMGCSASNFTINSSSVILKNILCPKAEDDDWHKSDCLFGNCTTCGVKKLPVCPKEEADDSSTKVPWEYLDYEVVGYDKNGKKKTRLQHQYLETTPKILMDTFRGKAKEFVGHNFRYKWQELQFRKLLRRFPDDTIISILDFAENYTMKEQNEVQSMHWHNEQISILVHLTYRRDPDTQEIIKEEHFYISDNKKHDSLFVQHCLMLHHKWLIENNIKAKMHVLYSDGAASQFKSSRAFYFVSRSKSSTGMDMMWNFWGSGHGKGEHDGAGAVIKRALRAAQLRGVTLRNAREVVEWLRKYMATAAPSSYLKHAVVKRHFWEISVGEVDRKNQWAASQIEGTRSFHCILGCSTKPTHLQVRKHSCFCTDCLEMNWDSCPNKSHTGEWRLVVVEPTITVNEDDTERGSEEPVYFGTADDLSSQLQVGDSFAVVAPANNFENAEFYIVMCTKPRYIVQNDFQDMHGQKFVAGDEVIEGYYFEKLPHFKTSYKLCRENKATVYVGQVGAIKLCMPQAKHKVKGCKVVYTLSIAEEERILDSLPNLL